MRFKALSPTAWETEHAPYDFHVRLEQDNYVIDVFEAGVDNPDEAHLTSHECETWEQVERYCRDYDGVTVV